MGIFLWYCIYESLLLHLLCIQYLEVKRIPVILCLIFVNQLAYTQAAPDNENDSLLAAFKNAVPDTHKVNRLFALCMKLNRANIPEELQRYAAEAMHISQKENYKRGVGIANYVNGFYQYAKRNYEQALHDFTMAQRSFELCGDKANAGLCMKLRGNISFDLGDYAGSVINYNMALQTLQAAGYKLLMGACSNDMALSYARMGNYSKGVEYAYKALKTSEETGDKKEMAQSLYLMGWLFFEFRNYENAIKNFVAASVIYQELKDNFGYARNNNMLGEVLLEQGHYSEAYERFYRSLNIYSKPGAPEWGMPWGYSNIGSVYEAQGDSLFAAGAKNNSGQKYNDALGNYTLALKKFEDLRDPAGIAEQTIFIGKVYFKLGQLPAAKKYLLSGLNMSVKVGEKKKLAWGYLYLSRIDSAEGNAADAYRHYKSYVLYHDSVYNMESSEILSLYKTQLEFEKKDHQITLLATENELQTALAEKQSQRRNFAFLLLGLLLAGGAYIFLRFRKQSKIRSEQKLLKERLAISQDLHDNIGSTLSSIAVYSEVAKIQGEKNGQQDMHELLEKISNTSNEMVTEMNDIVWAINPRNDSMEKIIQRMESFAKPLAAARNIHFDLQHDRAVLALPLNMDKRKNFYLIFKEAVNNAIKYSGAKEIRARINLNNKELILQVTDDGVGFNLEKEMATNKSSLSGNGLENMHKRAQEIHGSLHIETEVNKGTDLVLKFPSG